MPDLRLGILDQSPIPEGCNAGDALRNSVDLARLADGLGYTRYWVAEHHGTRGLACASPEALIGPIAAATSRLHVGSGGVMLPHYSPLKVAETFSMLERTLPRPYRPRHRPRRRNNAESRFRAPTRPPPGCAGRFSRTTR